MSNVSAESRLKRFLHYGSESGTYKTGGDPPINRYLPGAVPCIKELIQDSKGPHILQLASKVHKEKSSIQPEAILFALAMCALEENTSSAFKAQVYLTAESIIKKAHELLTFVKFLKSGAKPKGHTGRGVRKLIKKWYLKQSALELAEAVTMVPRYYGWSHRDLLRLSHIKCTDPGQRVVFLYVVKGIESVSGEVTDSPEVEQVVQYLRHVDDFRRSTDIEHVSGLIDSYSLTVKHVNTNVIKDKSIWRSLLKQIDLNDLLDNFQLLSRNKLLRNGRNWDLEFVECIKDSMGNTSSITESHVHPNRVFVELYKYKNLGKMKYDMQINKVPLATEVAGGSLRNPPQVNDEIITSLNKLLTTSFKNMEPTNMRYLIAVQCGENMSNFDCGHVRYIPPIHAAAFLMLSLARLERKVDVVAFSQEIEAVTLPTSTDNALPIDTLISNLPKVEKGKSQVDLKKLFKWAKGKKLGADVILVLGSYTKPPGANIITNLVKYAKHTGVKQPKLVVCSLRGLANNGPPLEDPHFLHVAGFDSSVLPLIQAFARGHF